MLRFRWWLALPLVLALGACDGDPPEMDAGTDAGPPPVDAGPPLACTSPTVLEANLAGPVSVTFDTSMTETRPRDLGLGCGNDEAELRWAPQEVVELHIPADAGSVTVQLDTVFEETLFYFNTVLQVRETCEQVPSRFPPTCFDDVDAGVLSQGSFHAEGGETYYIIVTGYSEPAAESGHVDEGTVRLDVSLVPNTPPTLTDAAVGHAVDDVVIYAAGEDANGNAAGVAMVFYDAAGEVIDLYGDGVASEDQDVFVVPFSPPPTTSSFAVQTRVRATDTNLGPALRGLGAARARVRVFDRGFAVSDALDVDIVEGTLVGFGETCDRDNLCYPEMTCLSGTCGAAGAVATACSRAIDLAIPAPTDTATSVARRSTTGAGVGLFTASRECVPGGSIGQERIYSVEVPEGVTADLLLTTDAPGTNPSNDTVIYVREACPDMGSELACNDDISPTNNKSEVEVRDLEAGTYFVFVEFLPGLGGGSIQHEIEATLRPVLATGVACDDAEVDNRCATGACTGGLCP